MFSPTQHCPVQVQGKSFLEPNLNIGLTLASFQMSGNLPFNKDELNIIDIGFDKRSATSLTTVVGTFSEPAAFPFVSCLWYPGWYLGW